MEFEGGFLGLFVFNDYFAYSVTRSLQTLDVVCNFDDGSDDFTCASFNPANPCIFAFADVCGNVGLRAIDRPLDAGLAGAAHVDFAVNCMGEDHALSFF